MSGHTPGPWIVRVGSKGQPVGIDAPYDDGPGGVGAIVRQNGIGFPSSPAAAANASLIAAAPELLEALKEVLPRLCVCECGPESGCADAILRERVRAIIAKAEGNPE